MNIGFYPTCSVLKTTEKKVTGQVMLKSFGNKVGMRPVSCLRIHHSALGRLSAPLQYLENEEILASAGYIYLCINDSVT